MLLKSFDALAGGAETWVTATLVVVALFVGFALPRLEAWRNLLATIGSSRARDLIEEHDTSPRAHPTEFEGTRSSVALPNAAVENLQQQINHEVENRRGALTAVKDTIELAIKLMEREP